MSPNLDRGKVLSKGTPVLMKGNEALAEAVLTAGCRHYFAYPITPQSEVLAHLSVRMRQVGGVFLQAESELAAISMVFGAAAAGMRAMTSSSSPGIALMQEAISNLSGSELPAVILSVMRGGPGLGNIRGAQGDYFQAVKGGGNGDYQTIVLAPASVQEMADFTLLAFDLADRYRMVTMILADGFTAQMSEPVILPSLPENWTRPGNRDYALDGAKDRESRVIASLRLKEELDSLEVLVERLFEKYAEVEAQESRSVREFAEDSEVLLCAYGMSARLCSEAMAELRGEGIKVGLFRPQTLWPFPKKALRDLCSAGRKKILVVEMSKGQFVDDVRLHTLGLDTPVECYGTAAGTLPSVKEIKERVRAYVGIRN